MSQIPTNYVEFILKIHKLHLSPIPGLGLTICTLCSPPVHPVESQAKKTVDVCQMEAQAITRSGDVLRTKAVVNGASGDLSDVTLRFGKMDDASTLTTFINDVFIKWKADSGGDRVTTDGKQGIKTRLGGASLVLSRAWLPALEFLCKGYSSK